MINLLVYIHITISIKNIVSRKFRKYTNIGIDLYLVQLSHYMWFECHRGHMACLPPSTDKVTPVT